HALCGTCKAAPVLEASITLVEQSAFTVGLACTISTSVLADSDGMMAIAKVCQLCGWSQGRGRAVTTPLISTSPAQHSGVFTHAALAPVTDAAGQCSVVVATPTTPTGPGRDGAGVLAAGVLGPGVRAPDVLVPGALAPDALAPGVLVLGVLVPG